MTTIPTFKEATGKVIALNAPTWKHPKTSTQWSASLQTYAFSLLRLAAC